MTNRKPGKPKKMKPVKPVECWAILDRDGELNIFNLFGNLASANDYIQIAGKRRVVRVRIEEVGRG